MELTERNRQIQVATAFPPAKEPPYLLDRRLGGPWNWSECGGGDWVGPGTGLIVMVMRNVIVPSRKRTVAV
jgi:hypothetical protein